MHDHMIHTVVRLSGLLLRLVALVAASPVVILLAVVIKQAVDSGACLIGRVFLIAL